MFLIEQVLMLLCLAAEEKTVQGTSHVGFGLAGAMTFNSVLYAVAPHTIKGDVDYLVHALGTPWRFEDLAYLWNWGHFGNALVHLNGDSLLEWTYKLSFYFCLIWSVRLPDSLERRSKEDFDISLGHRGFTHSVAIWMFLVALFGFGFLFAMTYCHLYHIPINTMIVRELCALALGILSGFVLHSVADMCTYGGVSIFWPAKQPVGWVPQSMRPRNQSWGEYAILWLAIFAVGALFALNIVGL